MDSVVASARGLVERPFRGALADSSVWLEGAAQDGARASFAPLAVFESLHGTPADFDGTAALLWEEAYNGFERHRRDAVAALTAVWGAPLRYSFAAEYGRVVAGDASVSELEYDLAMFTSGEPFPAWRHDGRIIALLLGQMDKEFPIVLAIAAIEVPG